MRSRHGRDVLAAGELADNRKRDRVKALAMRAMAVPLSVRTSDLPKRAGSAVVMLALAGEYGEKAKIAIRNVRRDGMEALKEDEKKKEISEDDRKRSEDDVQKMTDKHVGEVDDAVAKKEQEILTQ